ncbi:MAG: trypsin-like peptidase domain-containing protein [Vicinamibacterales bacterium]
MTGRFAWFTAGLMALVGFLVGLVVTGPMAPPASGPSPALVVRPAVVTEPALTAAPARPLAAGGAANFADVAERLNPAVVNIDATSSGHGTRSRRGDGGPPLPERPQLYDDDPFDFRQDRDGGTPRRGAGTGFVIDPDGYILTNHHVIESAERLTVKLKDGRNLRARVIGSDPDTDIALIKVDADAPLPFAPLGDSDSLRVGEWVCAIGNPLAYEHTVTVGVVSFIGRKLFDSSLDNYIQTDAAINFGNSGGPLINARGEVIGINSAISRQARNIGFAVPINQARAILPQLKETGRVSRGYIGVVLRDVDPDLQASLGLDRSAGALVQDVTPGSPGARAGLEAYDLITALDGEAVPTNDVLIREIAARQPGASVALSVYRDGRRRDVMVKLAERPARVSDRDVPPAGRRTERSSQPIGPNELGLTVLAIDESNVHRFEVPEGVTGGLLVQRVEPYSAAYDAGIERGHLILEVNRQPVDSVAGFRRIVEGVRPGGVLSLYVYLPELDQRNIRTLRLEAR